MMFKHILMLVLLSVAAIFFQNQLLAVLHFIMKIHDQIADGLGMIFSVSAVGEMVQSVLALLLIPVVLGVLVATAHFLIKQMHFPHTLSVIWVCWAVLLAAILTEEGHVSNHVIHMSKPVVEKQETKKTESTPQSNSHAATEAQPVSREAQPAKP